MTLNYGTKMISLFFIIALCNELASAQTRNGQQQDFYFKSPNGITEVCRALPQVPGGKYSIKDLENETQLCGYDFYDPNVALCPKYWSTSAATLIREMTPEATLSSEQYEIQYCRNKDAKVIGAVKSPKYKTTMNTPNTSATYSPSSLLYYHMSRYLQTQVSVPVSVYRTMDVKAHYAQVTSKVFDPNYQIRSGGMNLAAWNILKTLATNPGSSTYAPKSDLLTENNQLLYGVLIKDSGTRYGMEVNGIRSKWGLPQYVDMTRTPGFSALRSNLGFHEAAQDVIKNQRYDAAIAADLGSMALSEQQLFYWMNELSEITLMDFIFSQQDRPGNIDYVYFWIYRDGEVVKYKKEESEVSRKLMHKIAKPVELANTDAILVQRTFLGDNDAGGKYNYANFTKKGEMLETIRHLNPGLYTRLQELAKDFRAQGMLYKYFRDNFHLPAKEFSAMTTNTLLAADILKKTCLANQMKFDLALQFEPNTLNIVGRPVKVSCE